MAEKLASSHTGDDPKVGRAAVDRAYASWVHAADERMRMRRQKEVLFVMAGAVLGMVIPAVIFSQWWMLPWCVGGALSGFWIASSENCGDDEHNAG